MQCGCSKISEAEAAVSVNEKKSLVMHMHVRLYTGGAGGHLCKPIAATLMSLERALLSMFGCFSCLQLSCTIAMIVLHVLVLCWC